MNSRIYPIEGRVNASHVWSLLGIQLLAWATASLGAYFLYGADSWLHTAIELWVPTAFGTAAGYAANAQLKRPPILTGKQLWKLNLGTILIWVMLVARAIYVISQDTFADNEEPYPLWFYGILIFDIPLYYVGQVAGMWTILKVARWKNRQVEAKNARLGLQ